MSAQEIRDEGGLISNLALWRHLLGGGEEKAYV